MTNRIRQLLPKRKRGEGYIDVAVSVVVMMMLIVLAINVFSFLSIKQDMDYFARELTQAAAVSGVTSSSAVSDRYSELVDEVGFSPSCVWTAEYHDGNRVQYGESISVTLAYRDKTVGFGIFQIPISLSASYSALSQQYWK